MVFGSTGINKFCVKEEGAEGPRIKRSRRKDSRKEYSR
jgi:hypothetical protein